MELNESFGTLLFFAVFEILGGAGVGAGLRSVWRRDASGLFFLIWGAGFGGIPLIIGAVTFISQGEPIYFYAQLFLFVLAVVIVALVPDDLFAANRQPDRAEGPAIGGAIMTMLGGTVVLLTLQGGVSIPLLLGGFFALLGALLLVTSAIGVLRSL